MAALPAPPLARSVPSMSKRQTCMGRIIADGHALGAGLLTPRGWHAFAALLRPAPPPIAHAEEGPRKHGTHPRPVPSAHVRSRIAGAELAVAGVAQAGDDG